MHPYPTLIIWIREYTNVSGEENGNPLQYSSLENPMDRGKSGGLESMGVTKSQTRLKWISIAAAAAAKSLQSCPTLCDPRDSSPPGSPVPRILQARTLEWVAISFSNAWKWKIKVKSLSRVGLLATPWTAAYQAPPSMGFSRQEYWSGVQLPSPMYSSSYIILGKFSLRYHSLLVLLISWSNCFLSSLWNMYLSKPSKRQ